MQYTCNYCPEKFIDETNLQFHRENSLYGISLGRNSSSMPTISDLNNGFSSHIRHSNFDINYEPLLQRAFHTEKTPLECFISNECFTTEENLIQQTGIHESIDLFSCSSNPEVKNVPEFYSNSVLKTEPCQNFEKFAQDNYYEKNNLIHSDESNSFLLIDSNMNYPSCSSNTSVENSRNFNHLEIPNDVSSFGNEYTNTPTITEKETFNFPACQSDPNITVSVLRSSNMEYFSGEVDKFVEKSVISQNNKFTNVSLVTEKRTLISQVCQRSAVIRHERIHTDARPYPCRFCPKKFMTNSALVRHERIHSGKRPFSCRFCTKRFKWKSCLVEHESIHTGERPYPCRFCPHRCIRQLDLKRHERIHTGERPHACRFCSGRFTHISNLKRHERIHTDK